MVYKCLNVKVCDETTPDNCNPHLFHPTQVLFNGSAEDSMSLVKEPCPQGCTWDAESFPRRGSDLVGSAMSMLHGPGTACQSIGLVKILAF